MVDVNAEQFWQSLPTRLDEAARLWREGYTSTRARVAFEDLLFALKRDATVLGHSDARDVLAGLEAFAVTVPLSVVAARIAEPGVFAAIDMLRAMVHPNVSIHFAALFRLLTALASKATAADLADGDFRPVFIPPRPERPGLRPPRR